MRWWIGCKRWDCRLKPLSHPDHKDREGYVSLLAMSFAFGLAVFGSAMAVALRAYLVAAAGEQREMLDRITLESAANDVLGRLAAGQSHSIKPSRLAEVELNQRQISVELSLPEGKHDLGGDPDQVVGRALLDQDLSVSAALAGPLSTFDSLADLSRVLRLSATQEDCLRRVVTVGRAPEEYRPEAAAGGGEGLSRSAAVGDQVDLRVSLGRGAGQRVLWTRARFSGGPAGWALHDYRRLQGQTACPVD